LRKGQRDEPIAAPKGSESRTPQTFSPANGPLPGGHDGGHDADRGPVWPAPSAARRLVLLTDPRGLPLGYTLVPAGEKEYEPLADLLTGTPCEIVIADKGLWGRGYRERLAAAGVELLTPAKKRTAANEPGERRLASVRLAIESVFSNLKGQMRLERHLAKTPAGLAVRIAQRLLALTLGILLNTLAGRPARALAAYDGR
jgi:hypothetical protein